MSDRSAFPPSVKVGRLFERTSAAGNTYLSGFFGSMKITALKSKQTDAEGNPIWDLMISAAPPRDPAQRARQAGDDTTEVPRGRRPMQQPLGTPPNDEIPF